MRYLFLLTIILLCLLSLPGLLSAEAPPPAPGAALAELRLFDVNGKRYDIADEKAPVMVVVFWAFWCDTWKKALPSLKELQGREKELDFALWTVSIDGRYTEEIRPLVKAGRIPFPVLLDDGTVSKPLGIRRVPTVCVLDASRHVVQIFEGYPGNPVLERAIRGAKKK